jgi:glucose/arabinose dehydrogenase
MTQILLLASLLMNVDSVAVGADGRVYATVVRQRDGKEGAVVVLQQGKALPFATGLDSPHGLAAFQGWLYVAERNRVRKIDANGKIQDVSVPDAFAKTAALDDLAVDPENGTAYVSDGKAVYRVNPKGKVDTITDAQKLPGLAAPLGLALDGASFLLLLDGTGSLYRVKIADGSGEKIASGLGKGGRLAWGPFGRLYLGDRAGGRILAIARPGQKAVALQDGLQQPTGLCVDAANRRLVVANVGAAAVAAYPATVPGAEVDERPLALEPAAAFPELKWAGWTGESEAGLPLQLRPIVLTHAGDGSNRVFVAIQQGILHLFPNDPKARATKIFLDIQDKVRYDDKTNEEGLLGLTFHPNYKQNGEFFVFYTDKRAKLTNVVSRFRVRKDDPDRADPASEEEILRIEHPFWNHDGGTIVFGPDGYLYVALGDGGSGGDPFGNAQNLKSLLGKVLRLDVDRKEGGKPYAIPKDNPFVNRADARPETWAYGLRNPWRIAFDRATGKLWAADVGQNLYEEINILRAGGNFGWKLREGLHPFEPTGSGPRPGLIDPIWEYRHDLGRSITGGSVYRGARVPELQGAYVYGDYISCKLWALWYDEAKGRVVANRPLRDRNQALLSFGEDERGELYYLTYTNTGQGIYHFVRPSAAAVPEKAAQIFGKDVPFSEALLRSLPRRKAEIKDAEGKTVTYEGVALGELLRHIGIPQGKELKGPALAQYVLVEAADGYRAVFSLPECDPSMSANVALLADRKNGKLFDAQEGPYRLIAPQDRRRSRWVGRVARITVQTAATDADRRR